MHLFLLTMIFTCLLKYTDICSSFQEPFGCGEVRVGLLEVNTGSYYNSKSR